MFRLVTLKWHTRQRSNMPAIKTLFGGRNSKMQAGEHTSVRARTASLRMAPVCHGVNFLLSRVACPPTRDDCDGVWWRWRILVGEQPELERPAD